MRMPLVSYFVVMSSVLTALLMIVSSQMGRAGGPVIATSQVEGLPERFTPEREASPYRVTGTNFAAARATPTDGYARDNDRSRPMPVRIVPNMRPDYDNNARPAGTSPADLTISAIMAIH